MTCVSIARMTTPLPYWLTAAPAEEPSVVSREGLLVSFPHAFETILSMLSRGMTLKKAFRERFPGANYELMMRWIMRDAERKRLYYDAQEIGAETTFSELIERADGTDPEHSMETVDRARLAIDTRKYVIERQNRKRFGDVKQIEMNQNINLRGALEEARGRLIEGEVIRSTAEED